MVSIITPYYNGSKYILETVESCLSQTYQDIEYIIINDCSPNELPQSELFKDKRIRLLENNTNLGASKSCNKAAGMAKGDFLLFLGQDDVLEKDHLSKMIPFFRDSTVGFVFCNYKVIDKNGKLKQDDVQRNYKHEYEIFDFSLRNRIHSCGLMIRKTAFDQVGGYIINHNYPNYGEWNLWIRLLKISRGVFCDSVLPSYRRHGDNMTDVKNFYHNRKQLFRYNIDCRKLAYDNCKLDLKRMIMYHAELLKYVIWFHLKLVKCRFLN